MTCFVAGPKEKADCRQGSLPEHKERVPQTDVRRAGAVPGSVLQSLPR